MRDVATTLEELATETGWLRQLARSLVQDPAEADDLVHDAYVVAAEQAPTDGRPLRPWLVRVMRNLSRMRHRGARRRGERERAVASLAREPATPAELVDRIEMHRLLAGLVLGLAPSARDVVLLSYGEGLTSQQVGERLGIAAGTVRWRLKLALDELRDKLDAHQPKRVWMAALATFAGLPPRTTVALKLLVAAAIVLVMLAGWLALQVRGLERDARQGPDVAKSARRATPRSPHATSGADPARAAPLLEAPPMPGRRRVLGRVVDAQDRPVADADVAVTCGFYSSSRVRGRPTS